MNTKNRAKFDFLLKMGFLLFINADMPSFFVFHIKSSPKNFISNCNRSDNQMY